MNREEEIYSNKLSNFFETLGFRYRIFEEFKKQTDRFLASEFNFIDIIEPDENKISDIIAYILEPYGIHGQGEIFIYQFLEILKEFFDIEIPYSNLSTTKVNREFFTDKERRIDIVIELDSGFMIGIENKPWAGEQENQLEDYDVYLYKKSKDRYLLIYLDGIGREAESINKDKKEQLKKENKFLETSYHKLLIPWLKKCVKECESEKVRWFLKDLISWIEVNFVEEYENA